MKDFLCFFLCCVILVVMMMGKWSEESFLAVLQRVSIESAGVQKVMSGEDILRPTWWDLCVYSVRAFSVNRCCSSCSIYVTLVFEMLLSVLQVSPFPGFPCTFFPFFYKTCFIFF